MAEGVRPQDEAKITGRTVALLIGLGLCLAFPSSAKIQRYFGDAWTAVYFVAVPMVLLIGYRFVLAPFLGMSARAALLVAGATLVLLAAGFAVIFPLANSGAIGGGSDRDEAVNIGVTELLHGRYPYYARTEVRGVAGFEDGVYRGPLSQMPGALFLAVPFVALGNSAYQNFFWLVALFFALRWLLADARPALLFVLVVLFLSPVCLHEVMSGGDLLANSVWVFVFTLVFVRTVSDERASLAAKLLSAVLFGVGLSSRSHFVLIGPLTLSVLVQRAGWKRALLFMGVAAGACLAVTLPFVLYDPKAFTPLWLVETRMGQYQNILPQARWLVPGVGALLSAGLSLGRTDGRGTALARNCTIVLAWLVVAEVALSSIAAGRVDLDRRAWYGLSFLFFAAWAFWTALLPETPAFRRDTEGRAGETGS